MVRLLAICGVLLFSLLTAGAQAVNLPQCSPDQLAWLGELSPEIDAVEQAMSVAETMSDVLRVNTEQLALRQRLWDDMRMCDVNLEYVSLFSARYNDLFVVSTIEGLSPGQKDSARWRLLEGLDGETTNLVLSNLGEYFLSGLIGKGGDAPGEALPACTESQLQYARGTKLTGYVEILNQALAVETVDDLLRYDAAHLAFRESAWADLPRCVDAYEVAILMFRISGDFVVGHALAFLGVPRDSNAYVSQLMDDVAGLPSWMIPAGLRQPDAVYTLFKTSLPGCTAAELVGAAYIGHPLLETDGALEENFVERLNQSNLNIKTYARMEIDWRNRQFADAPRCREALEITLAMSETGGDMVAATGFSQAGEPELAFLYREQALLGAQRVQTLLANIAAAKEPEGELVLEQTQLPGCTADQLAAVVDSVLAPWRDMGEILPALESRADFSRFAAAQFQWRKDFLGRLPGCAEAVELGLWFHQGAGIFAGVYALDSAGVKQENNVYMQASKYFADQVKPLVAQMQQMISGAQ